MSLFNRRTFLLLGLSGITLAGCGYSPALSTDGAAQPLYGRIRAADPADEQSFRFVTRFEQRLGLPQAPLYDLAYVIDTDEQGLAITGTQETTRFNIVGSVDYTLTSRSTGAVALRSTVNSFTGYSATGTTVSTRTAREDAIERLMVILADQLSTHLIGSAGTLEQ